MQDPYNDKQEAKCQAGVTGDPHPFSVIGAIAQVTVFGTIHQVNIHTDQHPNDQPYPGIHW